MGQFFLVKELDGMTTGILRKTNSRQMERITNGTAACWWLVGEGQFSLLGVSYKETRVETHPTTNHDGEQSNGVQKQ